MGLSMPSLLSLKTGYLDYNEAERLLEVYSLEEILEVNDLTEADVLVTLFEELNIVKPL